MHEKQGVLFTFSATEQLVFTGRQSYKKNFTLDDQTKPQLFEGWITISTV